MKIHLRPALVGTATATAIALLAAPGAALASQGTGATTGSSATDTVATGEMPPGMHVMMSSPGHERFVASPGHQHVMSSPGHQAMMD